MIIHYDVGTPPHTPHHPIFLLSPGQFRWPGWIRYCDMERTCPRGYETTLGKWICMDH